MPRFPRWLVATACRCGSAGKVISTGGYRSHCAFARTSPTIASGAFTQALATAGVTADTPATVLSAGDAGLWRLPRESLPNATVVLDWWHAAVRFEHALQAARGLGAADTHLSDVAVRGLERGNGACGTVVGRDAGASSRLCAAGRVVRYYAAWLTLGAWSTS